MAAAEARAVWRRTANRYFVQEDAKRAPKLACCPSTSSSLSKQVDTRTPANAADVDDSHFLLPNDKSSYSYLSSDLKWWLQLQPDYMYQTRRGLTDEQVNALEAQNSHKFVENQDSTSVVSNMLKEYYELVEMDSVDCCKRLNELTYEFNMDPKVKHPMGIQQTYELPWWQVTEKDYLASFVSKRSHDSIENCELLWPKQAVSKPQRIKCGNAVSRFEAQPVTSKQNSIRSSYNADVHREKLSTDNEIESSKRKILEALRHSQTRAREAENAAKEAYAEKEHVVKLLFQQASHLFAYRQWIHLLQLQNLYYRLKTSPVSHSKTRKKAAPTKGKTRGRQRGFEGHHEHDVGQNVVVFVVGLGIVGAGLLLGWTFGWMLV